MTNPFAPQPSAPQAYARYLESLTNGGYQGGPSQGVATYDQFLQNGHIPQAPQAPQYAPQQYAPQTPQAPPAAPLAQGSLDDFYGQPSAAGGPGWKFATLGDSNTGIVSRAIGAGDVQQVTDIHRVPQFFKDGRPKFQLCVPVTNVDGTEGTWYVKGADRDELARAMAEAGAPAGPPEKGAAIRVTYVKDKPNGPGMNASKIKQVEYIRPAATPASAPAEVVQTTPQPTNIDAVNAAAAAYNAAHAAQNTPVTPVQAPAPAPVAPAQNAPAPAAVTLDAEQAALLAQLTGG